MTQSVIHPVIPVGPASIVKCEQCLTEQFNCTESAPVKMTRKWKGYAGCLKCGHPVGVYSRKI